jgi:hypothetical protein
MYFDYNYAGHGFYHNQRLRQAGLPRGLAGPVVSAIDRAAKTGDRGALYRWAKSAARSKVARYAAACVAIAVMVAGVQNIYAWVAGDVGAGKISQGIKNGVNACAGFLIGKAVGSHFHLES